MKRLFSFVLAGVFALSCHAQSTSTLALQVIVEDVVEPFPTAGKAQLERKLSNILTKNGIQSGDWQHQFFITASVVPQTKDVLPGPPPQIAENMDVTFYIGDAYNQLVFSSITLSVKGVGTTDAKCYLNALSNINVNSSKLATFVQEGKNKIIEYYNQQAQNMMLQAQNLAKMHDYEQAIWMLFTIPTECTYFKEASNLSVTIYKQMLQHQCQQNLAAAKSAWVANYDKDGAYEAGQYLALILPEYGCYDEAMELYLEIKNKIREEWDFEMKKYSDSIDLEKDAINAVREIGVAYGENQQPQDTHIGFLH